VTHADPRNHVLDGSQDLTNPFAIAKDNKSAMRPFAKLFWVLVDTIHQLVALTSIILARPADFICPSPGVDHLEALERQSKNYSKTGKCRWSEESL